MPDGPPWPRVSIVTPNYNYGHFIEETIRSVLLQGYPDLEYIVIDGGSTDDSVALIQKYADWLANWESEPDRGQAHAINKGFSHSTGSLLAWLNSDDMYFPSTLHTAALAYVQHPGSLLLGDVENFIDHECRSELIRQSNVTFRNLVEAWNGHSCWHQPGLFVPRSLSDVVGPLDERLQYAMDRDWLCRLTRSAPVVYLNVPVARFRIHGIQKTTVGIFAAMQEILHVTELYWDMIPGINKRYLRAIHTLREASICLAHHPSFSPYWSRSAAACRLFTTWLLYPRIIFSRQFLRLCRRLILPRWLMRSSPW